jgi:hypothetical protein
MLLNAFLKANYKVYLDLLSEASFSSNPIDIALYNGYAYIVCEMRGVYRVDISNPYELKKTELLNIVLTNPSSIIFNGAYAYISQSDGKIKIFNFKNLTFPMNSGTFDTFYKIEKMMLGNGYLYYIRKDFGLHVIDVSNPEVFIPRGNQLVPGDANGLYIKNNFAYVTSSNAYLSIINIEDLVKIPVVGTYNFGVSFNDVFVSDNYAYISQGSSGVQVINVKDPSKPKWETNIFARKYAKQVVVNGYYTWINDDVTIQAFYNMDPKSQLWAGSFNNNNFSINKFIVDEGKYIYLVSSDNKLKVLSITYSY